MWLSLLLRYWKPLLGVILVLSLAGYIYHKGKQAAQQAAELQQLRQDKDALESALKAAQAAAEAAREASERNDTVLPETRRATAERVGRADRATAAERLRDDQAATADYERAASSLRGNGPR